MVQQEFMDIFCSTPDTYDATRESCNRHFTMLHADGHAADVESIANGYALHVQQVDSIKAVEDVDCLYWCVLIGDENVHRCVQRASGRLGAQVRRCPCVEVSDLPRLGKGFCQGSWQ